MDIFAALTALARRWYLTLFLLIGVAAASVLAAQSVQVRYQDTASQSLVPPPVQFDQGRAVSVATENPQLASGTGAFAAVVVERMRSELVTRQVVARGGTADFTVTQGIGSSTAPILTYTATADSKEQVSKTIVAVRDLTAKNAIELQKAVRAPERSYATLQNLNVGNTPSELRGNQTRVAAAVAAIGLLGTLAIVILVDAQLNKRRGRGGRGTVSTASPGPASPSASPSVVPRRSEPDDEGKAASVALRSSSWPRARKG